MALFQFELALTVNHLVHLGMAYLLALPLGLNREQSDLSFGLRTFPLVAVVTCGFILVGIDVIDNTDGEARIISGIITGIGFIGGGAIITNKDKVKGTSSAASIWNTGAIGMAVAFDRLEIALTLSIINFITLFALHKIEPD